MSEKTRIRIGGASGFWGDSMVAAPQLVAAGVDYLVFDYLAETTMAILAAVRAKNAEAGYATDFVDVAMKSVLKDVAARGIKVIANAGGIHPGACAQALAKLAEELGVRVRIAVVEGDDVSAMLPALRESDVRDMFTGAPLPERMLSANAYLGAKPIAQALSLGADIVITGRCVDSAVTLGALVHAFGWGWEEFDKLAGGSLAGHIIECGCQGSGGLFTDWRDVPDWPRIGYPIVECERDGSFAVTKPEGSGGLIARAAVAEQLLYEIGDPGAYLLPDVICDFRNVRIEQVDAQHVRVSGARGLAPPDTFKVSATAMDGYRCVGTLVVLGIDAAAKARRTGEAILERTRAILKRLGFADYRSTHIELIGTETMYGPHARTGDTREVMLRVVVDHEDRRALDLFAREIAPAATSWSPGTTGPATGRPSASPLIRQFAFTVSKEAVPARVTIDGVAHAVEAPLLPSDTGLAKAPTLSPPALGDDEGPWTAVPLIKLAWARSGDKGNLSNIGVIAREAEWLPLLWRELAPDAVQAYLGHLVNGPVRRYWLPGIAALNLVIDDALDGGGPVSRRMDPLGKGMAQILLDFPVRVPLSLASRL